MAVIAYIGLGGNEGDRVGFLRRAVSALRESSDVAILRVSSVYESDPIGTVVEQGPFLNGVVELETRLDPADLLDLLHTIEADLDRVRTLPGGPRTIDLDLLLYGSWCIDTRTLSVPHPRMCERRFVLEPLLALQPDLLHPESGEPLATLLAALPEAGCARRSQWSLEVM